MDIAISGAHGLIGSALARSLGADGHRVRQLPRIVDARALEGADAVVNLAGAPIGGGRFTAKHKAEVRDSRVRTTESIVEAIGQLDRRPAVLVSGSAVGFYGADRGDAELTEASSAGDDFLAQVCVAWEAAAAPAAEAGVRVAFARTGIVLARNGGALKPMLAPFKLGLGGPTGPGTQWMSWITLDDQVAAIRHLIDQPVTGPVNLTAPNPVRNAEWATTLGAVLRRPARLRIPRVLAKLPAGIGELVDNLLLASQRVLPGVLTDSGFTFSQPDLELALRAVLSA